MERIVAEEQEPTAYIVPTVRVSDTPPFFRVEGVCSQAVKDIVAQADKVFQNLNGKVGGNEFKILLQKRCEQTKEKVLVQIKIEDQEQDKRLAEKEILRRCEEDGITNRYTSFRFNVAVKNAKLGKSVVVRVNPRSAEAFVWQQPDEGQAQVEAKVLIVNGSHQCEVRGRLFEKGERTDGLTAGKRGG